MKTKSPSDLKAIRQLLGNWSAATREGRKEDILTGHDARAVIFDVLVPLQYKGTEAYRRGWAKWQPPFKLPSLFDLKELKITVGTDIAFCHGLIRCGGELPSGKRVKDLVRATLCLRKRAGEWKIVHQHISMPTTK